MVYFAHTHTDLLEALGLLLPPPLFLFLLPLFLLLPEALRGFELSLPFQLGSRLSVFQLLLSVAVLLLHLPEQLLVAFLILEPLRFINLNNEL